MTQLNFCRAFECFLVPISELIKNQDDKTTRYRIMYSNAFARCHMLCMSRLSKYVLHVQSESWKKQVYYYWTLTNSCIWVIMWSKDIFIYEHIFPWRPMTNYLWIYLWTFDPTYIHILAFSLTNASGNNWYNIDTFILSDDILFHYHGNLNQASWSDLKFFLAGITPRFKMHRIRRTVIDIEMYWFYDGVLVLASTT